MCVSLIESFRGVFFHAFVVFFCGYHDFLLIIFVINFCELFSPAANLHLQCSNYLSYSLLLNAQFPGESEYAGGGMNALKSKIMLL